MSFEGEFSASEPFSLMKVIVAVFLISVAFVFGWACSKEEAKEVEKPKVVLPIEKPAPERFPVPVADRPGSVGEEEVSIGITVTAPVQEQETDSPQVAEIPEGEAAPKEEPGVYVVQKGDSLSKIAGREDVYGDPLKWPSLFRLNLDKLEDMKVAEAFELKWSSLFRLNADTAEAMKVLEVFDHEELPEGLKLKFTTKREAQENLTQLSEKTWVVNVLSSQSPKSLVAPAIMLVKKGYRPYISEADVKGQKWLRLRVGFFSTRSEAMAAGKDIMSILNADETWVTKVVQGELERYGAY